MEENNEIDFSELIQVFMENVKNEILTKTTNQGNIIHNKEIIDSLFNLLDYQITLVHQIFLFRENNKENNDNNSLENLMNINKDILVSMVYKFLSNLNSLINKGKVNEKNKYSNNNIMSKNKNLYKRGKIINLLYSPGNNNDILVSNSFIQNGSPIKKNMEKEFNSMISLTQNTPLKKIDPVFDSEKNSYKFLKNKNDLYNMKNKNKKNIYEKLYNDNSKCDHDEKRKNKALLYQSYSKSMKDIFVDLSTDYINSGLKDKKNFNDKKKKILYLWKYNENIIDYFILIEFFLG